MKFGKKNKNFITETKDGTGKKEYEQTVKVVDMSPEELIKDMYKDMCASNKTEMVEDMTSCDMAEELTKNMNDMYKKKGKDQEDPEKKETKDEEEKKKDPKDQEDPEKPKDEDPEEKKKETKDALPEEIPVDMASLEKEIAVLQNGKVKDQAIKVVALMKGLSKDNTIADQLKTKKIIQTETKDEDPISDTDFSMLLRGK